MLCSVAQLQKTLCSTFAHLINTSSAQLFRSAFRWCIYYWNKVIQFITLRTDIVAKIIANDMSISLIALEFS